MKRYVCLILTIALAALIFAGCSKKNEAADGTSDAAQYSGVVQDITAPGETNIQNAHRQIILTDNGGEKTGIDEISLFDEYVNAVSNEPALDEKDILASINKWSFEIYPMGSSRANAFILASLIDPYTFDWANEAKTELDKQTNSKDKVNALQNWLSDNFTHTQAGYFSGMPGNDPWGVMDREPFYPVYKVETPSEMKALSVYTGKNTGKCNSLALINANIMLLLGVSPDDIVQITVIEGGGNHFICFAKFMDKVLYFDNAYISTVGENGLAGSRQAKAILNYSVNIAKEFDLSGVFYNDRQTLIESFARLSELPEDAIKDKMDIVYEFESRKDILKAVLTNSESSEIFALAKYSYQSLYVKRPQLYLEASMRTSRAKDLADELKSPEEIFDWIKTNIEAGSIFHDSEDRIMTADEVIACKTGGLKDQAVLAFTLLKHNGYDPKVYICKDNAYVAVSEGIYEAKSWSQTDSIDGEVSLILEFD